MDRPQNPGWYDDPESPEQLRYFDGVVWTSHVSPRRTRFTAPEGGAAPVGQPPATPAPQHGSPHAPQGGWGAPPAPMPYAAAGPATPDGERLAGWWKRAAARIIDWVIVWLLVLPLAAYVFAYHVAADLPAFRRYLEEIEAGNTDATLPSLGTNELLWITAYVVALTIVATVYEVLFTTHSGATPGKKLLGIRVRLRERPGPLPLRAALLRTVLPIGGGVVGGVPVVGLFVSVLQIVDILLPLVNANRQSIHDLMAATNVVDPRGIS
jgi:uncharacterized RDD family membrane protein YckC